MASDESIESIPDIDMRYNLALADLTMIRQFPFEGLLESTSSPDLPYKLVGKEDDQQTPIRQVINVCQ